MTGLLYLQLRKIQKTISLAYEGKNNDLTLPQIAVLNTLLLHGTLNMTTLCELSGTDRSSMTDLTRRLMEAHYIASVRDQRDTRSVLITITPKGRKMLEDAQDIIGTIEHTLLANIGVGDRNNLRRALSRLTHAIST